MAEQYLDALVVGAGFGGIYQLKKLRDQGLSVRAIDAAGDVGGTWYWNRYPGAMSDTESYLYRYSWDPEDLKTYPWPEHYVKQPDVLAYLQHIVERFDLRKDIQFNTELTSAHWDDKEARWTVQTSTGDVFKARFMVTALGLLSRQNFPDIPGIKSFEGEMYHTGSWPSSASVKGKRIAVIGSGSTGVQVITAAAEDAKQLYAFQRNPQYSVPSGDGPVSAEYRQKINDSYEQIWAQVKNSVVAFGFEESKIPCSSVSEEERERVFEEAWKLGNGFRFMFWTFCDITYDDDANKAAADFIKRKIGEIVKDPEKARKLMPTQRYARRPLCDGGYYEQFNRDNVDIIHLQETPITKFAPKGIETSDGKLYEVDMIIFATGFDAVDGNYTRVAIKGRNGETLKDHWSEIGPITYLGLSVSNFPNLFMITGPNGPFTNIPPTIETHVEFISGLIAAAIGKDRDQSQPNGAGAQNGHANGVSQGTVIEATKEAETEWTKLCDDLSAASLFRKTHSWIFGSNVPGKKHAVLFYFGGLANYRKYLKEVTEDGYRGFHLGTS